MMKLLRSIKTNNSGASAAEYALIVAVMGGLVVAGAIAFGGSLRDGLTKSGTAITTQSDSSYTSTTATPPAP